MPSTASGSMDFSQNSGSYSAASVLASPETFTYRSQINNKTNNRFDFGVSPRVVYYYQRVYDAGTAGWCYYTKRFIDPTPASSETTPNYTGAISNHSVVEILDIPPG